MSEWSLHNIRGREWTTLPRDIPTHAGVHEKGTVAEVIHRYRDGLEHIMIDLRLPGGLTIVGIDTTPIQPAAKPGLQGALQ